MSFSPGEFILPRPGGAPRISQKPIPGPAEAAFTKAFGSLLPPAKFLNTANGKAAYYELLPSLPGGNSDTPSRVLFIHGVQTPALGMLPLARALQTSFPHAHLVLVDLWGHGLSDTPTVPHDAGLFHQLLDALLDRLDWPSAHLVGFSFGGAITAGYVALRPSRVQSFTLVAPVGLLRSSDFSAEQQGHLRGDDEAAARKWILDFLEGGELVVPTDWKQRVEKGEVVAEAVREWQTREHPGHVASIIAIVRDGGVMDTHAEFLKAARTGIPSLAVLGELDDLCSERQLNQHGFANVAIILQVGHGVVRERVPEVAALVSDFWTKLGKASTD
ncbi:alpha/beta-hydrolase [Zopfia rhizophila CBS 207.26]|uniref:Alpha/beta-hydrolase n=1 Tax=Zopfia rhizophila CBS 207.26 TaxID=1314779 RepID=A0A6A6DR56_9PEZI|nr:alpha/beta-hydrolase [Zopfia rhizophila CBS 207.26]